MCHPTRNQGMRPADVLHKSRKRVWLQCPGCRHGCGRRHEWEARVYHLTRLRAQGGIVCPFCESKGGSFCLCQSVAEDPRLSKEWHPDNPISATQVARNSNNKYLWLCPGGHAPYEASCRDRCCKNTGCPECGGERSRKTIHPSLSVGRPDLAEGWDVVENGRVTPGDVTLGSNYVAWWRCRDNPEHFWPATVYSRALRGTGCPECREVNRFKPRIFGSAP